MSFPKPLSARSITELERMAPPIPNASARVHSGPDYATGAMVYYDSPSVRTDSYGRAEWVCAYFQSHVTPDDIALMTRKARVAIRDYLYGEDGRAANLPKTTWQVDAVAENVHTRREVRPRPIGYVPTPRTVIVVRIWEV